MGEVIAWIGWPSPLIFLHNLLTNSSDHRLCIPLAEYRSLYQLYYHLCKKSVKTVLLNSQEYREPFKGLWCAKVGFRELVEFRNAAQGPQTIFRYLGCH